MSQVFLSYKREDLAVVTRLIDALRKMGFEVWWDQEIPPGAPWESSIEQALTNSMVVLVCWSSAAVISDNVRSEARWAREHGRLFQLFIEHCSPPLFFGEHQGIDLSSWTGDLAHKNLLTLVATIRARLGEADSDKTSQAPLVECDQRVRKRLLLILSIAGCLAIAAAGAWLAQAKLDGPGHGERIAILPLETISSTPMVKDFASGLTASLQNALAAGPVQIIPPADAATLAGPERERSARSLDVGLMLEGSVQSDRDQLIVHLRLDDPFDHITLWTRDFHGKSSDPEALQAQTGANTVAVLTCAGEGLRGAGGLKDASVLMTFIRACDIEQNLNLGDVQQIYSLFDTMRQVTAKAPNFASGHAYLAVFLAYLRSALPGEQQAALSREERREAERALAIDPKQAIAYAALEELQPVKSWKMREVILEKGLTANPASSDINGSMGQFLLQVGRLAEARAYFLRAVAANPQSADLSVAYQPMYAGSYAEDDNNLARYSALWPHSASDIRSEQIFDLMQEGRWTDARTLLAAQTDFPPLKRECLSMLINARVSGDKAEVAQAANAFIDGRCAGEKPDDRAVDLALLGHLDDAFLLAERVAQEKNSVSQFLFLPATAAMRRDPRFILLAQRFGLVEYWQSTGKWPDFCSLPDLRFNCKAEAAKFTKR